MTSNEPVEPVGPVGEDSAPAQMSMAVREILAGPPPEGALGEGILFRTSRGDIQGILHRRAQGVAESSPENSPGTPGGVVWVCGARGGFGGPGPGSYERLAEEFRGSGITSLRLDYRLPNLLDECVLDLLVGVAGLHGLGCGPVIVVGHSFGGAVVIAAAADSPTISGVVSLSPQTYGADGAGRISPRPILLAHGTADTRLPFSCAVRIHDMAQEPKKLVLLEGAEHRLEERRDELEALLRDWIPTTLTAAEATQ